MKENITLKTVKDLLGMQFFIPSYQRGYKWTKTQVDDLLNDLDEFMLQTVNKDSFYCLQPLVVKMRVHDIDKKSITWDDIHGCSTMEQVFNKFDISWEVIDGQQRLTTIFLMLKYLSINTNLYQIKYETRANSTNFLNNIQPTESDKNVDYFHMWKVYEGIGEWFNGKDKEYKTKFQEILLNHTQFIWHECEEDAKTVFTRLNIGKIELTNSELIKAILLKDDNYKCHNKNAEAHRLRIAMEWDAMEQQLQDDEFWMFFADITESKPNRIDILFEIVYHDIYKRITDSSNGHRGHNRQDINAQVTRVKDRIGSDQYSVFRLFDLLLAGELSDLLQINEDDRYCLAEYCWEQIRNVYLVLLEWYKDLYFYHYVGFLVEVGGKSINDLMNNWKNNNKDNFKAKLIEYIKEQISKCIMQDGIDLATILDQQYEIEVYKKDKSNEKINISKRYCRPILLLHNIQSVIYQNCVKKEGDNFDDAIFYRFPFHLFRKRNGNNAAWDVEHIDSNEHNSLTDNYTRLLWLLQYQHNPAVNCENSCYHTMLQHITDELEKKKVSSNEDIKKVIKNIKLETQNSTQTITFEQVADEIEQIFGQTTQNQLSQDEKNCIWNFALLDSHTNRSYGNSIFPAKRRTIAAKDRRMVVELAFIDGQFVYTESYDKTQIMDSFIPPITRNVFMKYYTPEATDFFMWSKEDAKAYKSDMSNLLKDFIL